MANPAAKNRTTLRIHRLAGGSSGRQMRGIGVVELELIHWNRNEVLFDDDGRHRHGRRLAFRDAGVISEATRY